jgi:hypothetical protein
VGTSRGELLGAQIVGPSAGEYINELTLALQARVPLGTIAATVHVYPRLALAIQQAAGSCAAEHVRNSAIPGLVRRYLHWTRVR